MNSRQQAAHIRRRNSPKREFADYGVILRIPSTLTRLDFAYRRMSNEQFWKLADTPMGEERRKVFENITGQHYDYFAVSHPMSGKEE